MRRAGGVLQRRGTEVGRRPGCPLECPLGTEGHMCRAGGVLQRRGTGQETGHADARLSPGARFVPPIVMRRAGGVLQRFERQGLL